MEKYWKVVQTFQPRYQSGKYANHLKFFTLPPSWIYHQVELVFGSPNKLRVGKLQKLPPRIFAYHLHKALTNWLLRVNSYQPWTQLEKQIAKIKKKPNIYAVVENFKWESNATLQYRVMMVQYCLGAFVRALHKPSTSTKWKIRNTFCRT